MPRLSAKTETISVSLPTWLIDLLDEVCVRKDFSRSCFTKRAIKQYILHQIDDPDLWEQIYTKLMTDSKQ